MNLKHSILAELETNRGAALSGQALAERFGVSRNAVWKAINALKAEGYAVESAPNRGYRLAADCDRLSESGIRAAMHAPMIPIRVFETLDSTNNEGKRLLAAGQAAPFIVAAEGQSAGRGRRGHTFFSPQGAGLYMTVALNAGLTVEDALGVTACAAVCVTDAVAAIVGRNVQIQWVNDLFLNGLKVGGILTEAVTDFEGGTVESLLVGVGLNLRPARPPEEWRDIIGTLRCDAPVKNRLAGAIADGLLAYRAGDAASLARYREQSLTLGRRVACRQGDRYVTGVAEDIDATGALRIHTDSGEWLTLRSGEVSFPEP